MDPIKYLSRIDLFRGLSGEELRQLNAFTPMHTCKKGTVVASPHLERKALYLIKAGKVRLYKLTEDGKELTLDLLRTGHIFGDMTSFRTETRMFAVTMEDSVICSIDREQFQTIIGEKPGLALAYIDIVTARLKEVEEWLEYMAYGSVRKRLLFLLNKLSAKFGAGGEDEPEWGRLQVELTHQELASMTGSMRETITPLLNRLVSEGVLRKEAARGPYWIHRERLRAALAASK
ncbi:Crp/Fnr family transcriptional regulator [Paenibacillus sp. GYB003]|uniref:Crp/Fnr family transcriptional regulator n=1 Tax=Paenibacillus sp. GYB003 TaxID=2994392 RepID=UPI002F965AC5